MLADAALIDQQTKVHALGLNWTNMPSPTLPMAIVVFTELEQSELPAALSLKIQLLDSNQKPAGARTNDGKLEPIVIEGVGTAAPWEESRRWEPLRMPWSVAIGPIALDPGNYIFRVTVSRAGADDTLVEDLRFRVRPSGT